MKTVCTALLLLLCTSSIFAQSDSTLSHRRIYYEMGGNGLYYSANYHHVFRTHKNWSFGARVGISVVEFIDGSLPCLAMVDVGKRRLSLSGGVGATAFYSLFVHGDYEGSADEYRHFFMHPTGRIALHWRPLKTSPEFFVEGAYTPTYEHDEFRPRLWHWAGLSLGTYF